MINGIGVHIKVNDFDKSTAFYKALGFKKVFEYGPNKVISEDYSGMVFNTSAGKIEIASGHRAVKPVVFNKKVSSSKISLMINVSSISEVINRAKKAGITLSVGPRHYYWGTLEVVIKDPDGVVLVFIAPFSRPEAKKLHADEKFGSKL